MYNKKSNIQISPSFLTLPAFYQFVCYTDLKKKCARQISPRKQRRLFALASSSILLLWVVGRAVQEVPVSIPRRCKSVKKFRNLSQCPCNTSKITKENVELFKTVQGLCPRSLVCGGPGFGFEFNV